MKKLVLVICAAWLASCNSGPNYSGDWHLRGSKSAKITATLGAHYIGCAEENYYYKMANGEEDPGEALVYCPREDGQWDSYLVWYTISKVMGVAKEPDWTPPAVSPEVADLVAKLNAASADDTAEVESAQKPQHADAMVDAASAATDAAEEAARAAEMAGKTSPASDTEPSTIDAAAQAAAAAEAASSAIENF